ncbi:hypothetical protein [Aeromonas caviae]|uniref:hypothetical protein n=1 Tax=Aeromonas caviae TaxID=648 RepID=UPI002B483EC1|nr:hypothetical protein [Aeromonas caviae]
MEYISEIVSFILGAGAGFTLHIFTSKVSQNNNIVGGDLIGGNKGTSTDDGINSDIKKNVEKHIAEKIKNKKG